MSKQKKKPLKVLKIKNKCRRKILTWAKSTHEIGFICAGKNKKITQVYQVWNKSDFPKNRFKWDFRHKKKIKRKIKCKGMRIIAEGHSHPNSRHLKYPSAADRKYFSMKRAHLIAFPTEFKVRCWWLGKTKKETKELKIIFDH